MSLAFPADFAWGVATSAFQIEGASAADGKGPSIWDEFVRQPGRVIGGATGDVACDHYHRWQEDIGLMARLGVTAYRFSIAWSRVIPDGSGTVNRAGLGFYDRLVDELLAHGITPYATLYHWDLPAALAGNGGWPERRITEAFVHYADVATRALGDRVTDWITLNEPWVATFLGYRDGVFAPGIQDWGAALAAAHHLLLAHGRAVPIIRANSPRAQVGIALDCRPSYPASDAATDAEAQRHFDGFRNRWFFDPVFGRGYPDDVIATYRQRGRFEGDRLPFLQPGDLDEISVPLDFLGVNYYTSIAIKAGSDETEDTGVAPGVDPPDGYTEMGWPITPDALTGFLVRVHETYRPERIYITENGASFSDGPGPDGAIRDARRIAYLDRHLRAAHAAIERGVPLAGYFEWSLLDNLEWTQGFSQRFGLVWVDHSTGRRVPKESFDWYSGVVQRNALDRDPA